LQSVPQPASGAEGKFRVLFEQASDAIVTLKADGVIDEVNQAFEELTGYLRSELTGKSIELLAPSPAQLQDFPRARVFDTELFGAAGTHEDVAIRQKDGFVRLVDVTLRSFDAGEHLVVGLFRDVTEKKRMERELITKHSEMRNAYIQLEKNNTELKALQETLVQAGKMAALGELAAGIAHELNQPLQGIRGYAQELQALPSTAGETEKSFLKEIVSSVDKMATIIQYLRTFTRKSTESFESADVHHAVEEALKMLSRQFASRGIQVHREFGKNIPAVYGNPLQLEQVFINLSTNARDAIESTGRGSGNIWITTRDDGDFVEVSFRDDGGGMNERTKSKIFNPFFTTKEVGQGMGLGLSLSYGILNKIHASIVVESELGKGTRFIIRIPKDFREVN
jgi:PAS domain S-box-containing protein